MYDRLVAAPAGGEGTGLVVTFDEGSSSAGCRDDLAAGGQVATIVAGPRVACGVIADTSYNHYSLLASVKSLFGLDRLGDAAAPSSLRIPALG